MRYAALFLPPLGKFRDPCLSKNALLNSTVSQGQPPRQQALIQAGFLKAGCNGCDKGPACDFGLLIYTIAFTGVNSISRHHHDSAGETSQH